jgi:hypothetical protein
MDGDPGPIDFTKHARLYKWPSLGNQRRPDSSGPYTVIDGTLDDCIKGLMEKPAAGRHLYEIHTVPEQPLVGDVISVETAAELARLRDFL